MSMLLVAFVGLGRLLLHDELVGARYFLFAIPISLVVSGFGFAACFEWLPARVRDRGWKPALAVLALASGLASRSAYATRYAFQDEYDFARHALAQLPDRCVVYEVPLRSTRLGHDVDCCLDVDRSPLVLDFPRLRFRDLPDDVEAVFEEPGCVAYFESVACAFPSREDRFLDDPRALRAAAYFGERCSAARSVGRLEPVARSTTSTLSTNGYFDGRRPAVSLSRWYPAPRGD
jgi:hypothetical protein